MAKKKIEPKSKKPSKYYQSLFAACKRKWSGGSPMYRECLKNALVPNSKLKKMYCAHCRGEFAKSEIAVDHINAIGDTKPQTQDRFIYLFLRMDCPTKCLQVLCKNCHRIKTNLDENGEQLSLFKKEIKILLKDQPVDVDLDDMEFKDVKRLHVILTKIKEGDTDKIKKTWRKKLLEFMEGLR